MSQSRREKSNSDNDNSTVGQAEGKLHLPQLFWEHATAYDLFISLNVLHHPEEFGLRAPWAAGVRSRLSPDDRKTLEQADNLIHVPFHWIYHLPAPKDGATVLWALRQLEPVERLLALSCYPDMSPESAEILRRIVRLGTWEKTDLEGVGKQFSKEKHAKLKTKDVENILNIWSESADFGERYLAALESYQHAFFAEEEQRISADLEQAVVQAQALAEKMELEQLLEYLSQGLHLPEMLEIPKLLLLPSYWCTPLTYFGKVDLETSVMAFGARPANASLVPGEVVPDALLRILKAMADPTRLRILRYLAHEALTQAEIARRLRLRAPTVTHHLKALRLAGLVHITLEEHIERRYEARLESIQGLCSLIEDFLSRDIESEDRTPL